MMTAMTHSKLLEARNLFITQLAIHNVVKTPADITMDLINIPCGFRLHNDMQGAMTFSKHIRKSHRVDMDVILPSFTKDADCKSFKVR